MSGYVGIERNEMADALAKRGATSSLLGPEPFCGVTEQSLLEKLKGEEIRRSQFWRQEKIC